MTLLISPRIINEVSTEYLNYYAAYLYFKGLYVNSCIFGYSIWGLSVQSRMSRTFCKKYVSQFLKWGWCSMHCGNLIFHKQAVLADRGHIITIRIPLKQYSYQGIKHALQAFLIRTSMSQQKHAIQKKRSDHNSNGNASPDAKINPTVTCSSKLASRILRTTRRNANRILLQLQKHRWLDRRQWRHTLTHTTNKLLLRALYPNITASHYYHNGNVVLCYPSTLTWRVRWPAFS